MQCPTCARENGVGARFCAHCGAALAGLAEPSSAVETVAAPPGAAASPPRPPPSTNPFDQARFIPGTMVADRYRIVALLGRGGMGEVYRAEDLKLGQAVALKFLPERLARNPDRLARFHQEVRLARQIAHPNVCRVYDVGDAEGQPYLSMEYVDGEDLSSLLRRIGRLPADKAVQLAKQLCAGLAAAHDRGVLHGDLKPANVLVDGRGRIRIADFGLAGLADGSDETRGTVAGTPGYMAPEQLAGQGTSMRTDVYALGLVLYEMCTGKPALDRDGRPGQSRPGTSTVTHSSEILADIDPAIERVILRCLEEDPARRPPSAVSVAAALPGGDPLAAALAAGETPSPELMVAAGGTSGASRLVAAVCLAAIVVGTLASAWLSRRTTPIAYVPLNATVEVMAERTRQLLVGLDLFDPEADAAFTYMGDATVTDYIRRTDQSASRWDALRSDRLTAVRFWYRQGRFPSLRPGETVGYIPGDERRGTVSVVTDPAGRLTRLVADLSSATEATAGAGGTVQDPDWALVFELAGLDLDSFAPVTPRRTPPLFVGRRWAWEGVLADGRATPVRIEAGDRAGAPAYFEIVAPWTPPPLQEPRLPRGFPVFVAFVLVVFVLSLGLARRNARMGRADLTGAFRTAAVVALAQLPRMVVHGPLQLQGVWAWAIVTWTAGICWVLYMALEPYVRRLWPEVLIGWRALMAGRARDPLVGRDLLAGTVGGVLLALGGHGLAVLMPAWFGHAPEFPSSPGSPWAALYLASGGLEGLAYAVGAVYDGLTSGLPFAVVLVLLVSGLRSRRVAVVALLTVMLGLSAVQGDELVVSVFNAAVMVALLVRFGLLAYVMAHIPASLLLTTAIRFDTAPYATSSYVVIGSVAALTLWGLHAALGGRSLLGDPEARDATVPAAR